MEVGVGLSQDASAEPAAAEAAETAASALSGDPTLAVIFVSASHHDRFDAVAQMVRDRLSPGVTIGALAQGVIGPDTEVEAGPGVVVWAAAVPLGQITPFRSWALPQQGGGKVVAGWPDTHPDDLTLLLADPFTYPTDHVLTHVGRSRPGHAVVGGLVTAGRGVSRVLLDGRTHDDGAVGVVLRDIDADPVVAQGCRPVGEPATVTRVEGNVILELAGESATARLQRVFDAASPGDRDLMRTGLQVGVVADEYRDDHDTGDFVIRGILGADERRGGIAVNAVVDVGRTVQFQVLDQATASAELHARLEQEPGPVAGSLLFACNGRGRGFFGEADHDVRAFAKHHPAPVAGAFCAGEIGPVGESTWLHSFTVVAAILRRSV